MEMHDEDLKYCEKLFDSFYDVGSEKDGGVTRLGYTEVEDKMHEIFKSYAKDLDCDISIDEVGNTYMSNTKEDNYTLIGSHLDSVIEGGRYDGVAGNIAGLMILNWLKRDKIHIPIKVVAFRCEESSNFNLCTIGSGLITHEYTKDLSDLVAKNGETLGDIFKKKNLNIHPPKIEGMKRYLELHIEQGKVLDELGIPIGIVETIAGPRRFKIFIKGSQEHSGATPMNMRKDGLCLASEIILRVEALGIEESKYKSVATVGVVNNHPNVLNVIPGEVELGVDIRGIDKDSIDRLVLHMKESIEEISKRREIECEIKQIGDTPPVHMTKDVIDGLVKASENIGLKCQVMPSGAGHDAMAFPSLCSAGMVFIPCKKGISHSPKESAQLIDIVNGARVMYEYLKENDLGGVS